MKYLAASTLLVFLISGCDIRGRERARSERAGLAQEAPLTLCGCGYGGDPASMTATANVLIFGDATTAMGSLREALDGLGHTVTVSPILPDALHTYNTIWHVGNTEPLTPDERARLASYALSGGGLHLTGERSGGDDMNDSLGLLIGDLVAGGGIQVGRLGDISSPGSLFDPYPINPGVLGRVAYEPNAVTGMRMMTPGGLAGIAENRNHLVFGRDEVLVGALWDSGDLICGAGALSIIMDNGWFDLIPYTSSDSHNAALLENLQTFLHRLPAVCIDSDGDGVPDAQDACPDTSAGQLVNEAGCSIDDLCPCDASWKNHGDYASCVSNAADGFVAAGLITEEEADEIVSAAADSDCGEKD